MAISGNTIAHEALVDQNAVDWRRQFQRMLGYDFVAAAGVGSGGVARSGDCAVSQRGAGANMSVDVAAGFIAVGENSGGTGATGTAGVWTGFNDAVLNVPISASDPVNPRIDRIGFGIRDAAYSGATNDGQITVITGTPAGVPAAPAIPATYIAWVDIAQVAVAALAASIVNANITDYRRRLAALGGTIPVSSFANLPATNLWTGMKAFDYTNLLEYVYNGSAWVCITPQSATVATSQTSNSATYVDLATAGPTVSSYQTGTKALVTVGAAATEAAPTGQQFYAGFAISGATTRAANDNECFSGRFSTGGAAVGLMQASNVIPVTGLTAGANTFKEQYHSYTAVVTTWANRNLTVVGIP